MTHQPGTPEQRSAAGSAPDPAPAGGESPVGEGPEGRPDSRRVWLDRTDALFEDLPGSGSPTSMSPYGAAAPVPPAPPVRRVGSSVPWPSIDAASTGLERPDWDQWRRYQDRDQSPAPGETPARKSAPDTPKAPSKAAAQSAALARRTAGTAKRLGGPGWVPVVVMAAVMVMSFGVRPYGGGFPGHYHGPPGGYGMTQFGDAYGVASAADVAPKGADTVQAPVEPATVRLELVAATGTTATVTYGSDGRDTQRAEHVSLPWAVEAPLTADNNSISVTGAQEETGPTPGSKAALTCRVYLDDVLVSEQRSRGMAACTTTLDAFRSGAAGQGAALSPVNLVQPTSTVMPPLPTAGATVTFETYSSDNHDFLDVDFGPPGNRGAHREHQPPPAAWQASVTKNVGLVTVRVRQDGPPRATSTLMCRILVDDVVVAQSLNAGPVSCSSTVGDVVGA